MIGSRPHPSATLLATLTLLLQTAALGAEFQIGLEVTSRLTHPNTPMSVTIDFADQIRRNRIPGVLDANSIRVINATTGQQVASARTEDFAYSDRGRIEWVIADRGHTTWRIRFRTTETRLLIRPQGHVPAIGVGDLLRYNAGPHRPITSFFQAELHDLTGDGRPDLIGSWNYAYRDGDPWAAPILYPSIDPLRPTQFGNLQRLRYFEPKSPGTIKDLHSAYSALDCADFDSDGLLDIIHSTSSSLEKVGGHLVWRKRLKSKTSALKFADPQRLAGVSETGITMVCASRIQFPASAKEQKREPEGSGKQTVLVIQHHAYQHLVLYRQATRGDSRSAPRFERIGRAESPDAVLALSDQAWPSLCDWDSDGDQDLLIGGGYGWPQIVINSGSDTAPRYENSRRITAQGTTIRLLRNPILGAPANGHNMGYPYPVLVDWDADGRPDLVCPNETNRIFWFRNIGTKGRPPKFGPRQQVLCDGFPDSAELKTLSATRAASPRSNNGIYPSEPNRPFFWRTGAAVADFNGDGLLDLITCEGSVLRAAMFTQYRDGRGNLKLKRDSVVKLRDGRELTGEVAKRGDTWTESFRAVDWDRDGLLDLVYSTGGSHHGTLEGGSIYLLRNVGTPTSPLFDAPRTMKCYGRPIRITNHGPHPWIGDYNGDGLPDVIGCVEWSVYPYYSHAALEMDKPPTVTLQQATPAR